MLITFEGIDGCGKSTQVELLAEWLAREKIGHFRFREPGGTELSEKLRDILLDSRYPMDPITELLLFSAARSELVSEKVKPALESGKVVLLDRFYDSTVAYQGYGRRVLQLEQIHSLNLLAAHGLVPDITFYLKIQPEEAVKRLSGRKDRMEEAGSDFFDRVAEGFDRLARTTPRFTLLDATEPIDTLHQKIVNNVKRRLAEG